MYKWIPSLLAVVMMTGCEQQNHEKQPQTAETKRVDYLRLPLNENFTTLDPTFIYKNAQVEVVEQLFLGLTDFDQKTHEVVPELATHWQVNEDGTVYTYKLRQDAKWTDGSPVTAHDVVWAIQRNIAKQTDSLYAFTLFVLKNAKAIRVDENIPLSSLGVRAIDDYTVEFTLEQPAAYFPVLTGFWTYAPLPRKTIEQHEDDWVNPTHIQTNGPYQLVEWKKDSFLILKKNPNYYEADQVKISEVHYRVVPDSSLGFAMYKKDELDIIGGDTYLTVPESELSDIKSDPILRKEKQIQPRFCTEWYGFNIRRAPMDNPLVRKAIAAAIDKKTLIDIVINAEHSPAMTFTRPPVFGAVEPTENVGIHFDPILARALLAKAGYPNGKDFPKLILVHNFSERHQKTAKGIKTMLKYYLNIDVDIHPVDFGYYTNILKVATTPHIFRMSWCAPQPDANFWLHDVFHPQKGINWIGWDNLEFAKIVEKAQEISNPAIRKKLYRRAEEILTETEAFIIPLYFSNTPFMVKPWVKGWSHKEFGGQHVRHWKIEGIISSQQPLSPSGLRGLKSSD